MRLTSTRGSSYLLLFALLIPSCLFAQKLEWEKTIGNELDFQYLQRDFAGNFYIGAQVEPRYSVSKLLLIKVDTSGNKLWSFSYDTTSSNDFYMVNMTTSRTGDTYISGWEEFDPWDYSEFLMKVSPNGKLIWARFDSSDYFGSVKINDEENIFTLSKYGYPGNAHLSRLDSSGNFLWTDTLPRNRGYQLTIDYRNNLIISEFSTDTTVLRFYKYNDNGTLQWTSQDFRLPEPRFISTDYHDNVYFFTDQTPDPGLTLTINYEAKIFANGNFAWMKTDTSDFTYYNNVQLDAQGSMYLAGQMYHGGTFVTDSATLLKINSNGKIDWLNKYGQWRSGYGYLWESYQSASLCDDHVFVAGSVMEKIDTAGNIIWNTAIPIPLNENFNYDIVSDAVGNLFLFRTGEYSDLNILKYKDTTSFIHTSSRKSLTVFPNPVRDRLNFIIPSFSSSVIAEVFDESGRIVETITIPLDCCSGSYFISVSHLPQALYFLRIKDGTQTFYAKFLVQ